MLKRSLLVLGLVGCMSAFASAEVFVEYWEVGAPGEPTGANEAIVRDVTDLPVTIPLQIGVTGGPRGDGTLLVTGADFNFSWPAGFNMTNFQWDNGNFPEGFLFWFLDNSLPAPALAISGPLAIPAVIPVGPAPQLALATVSVSIDASVLEGDYSITAVSFEDSTNPTINDLFGGAIDIDPGSNSIPFHITPEPATLALLVLGGFTALRRRRS